MYGGEIGKLSFRNPFKNIYYMNFVLILFPISCNITIQFNNQ